MKTALDRPSCVRATIYIDLTIQKVLAASDVEANQVVPPPARRTRAANHAVERQQQVRVAVYLTHGQAL